MLLKWTLVALASWIHCQSITVISDMASPSSSPIAVQSTTVSVVVLPPTITSTVPEPTRVEQPESITTLAPPPQTTEIVVTDTLGVTFTTRIVVQPTQSVAPSSLEPQNQGMSDGLRTGLIIGGVAVLAAAVGIYAFRTFGLQVRIFYLVIGEVSK
jgi:hypothetical protein